MEERLNHSFVELEHLVVQFLWQPHWNAEVGS